MSIDWRTPMIATLQAIDGSAPYTLDLSGAGQVVEGRPPSNVRPPDSALVYVYRLDSTYTRGEPAPLKSWDTVQRVGVSFYVHSATQDGAAREAVMDNIADDLHSALAASLTTGGALATAGILQCSEIAVAPFYGSQQAHKSHPVIVDAQLTLHYIDDGST